MGEGRRTPPNASNPTANQRRVRRVTVHEAARVLNVSEDAVRMRIKRGTLEAEKEGGRLYVLLTSDPTTELTRDRNASRDRTDELIEELRDRVRSLEEQLGQERDANRENRRIIAALTQRIPEASLEAPEATSPEVAEESQPRSDAPATPEGASEARPWWRRLFEG
jgi:excisionase family DNA binding protein